MSANVLAKIVHFSTDILLSYSTDASATHYNNKCSKVQWPCLKQIGQRKHLLSTIMFLQLQNIPALRAEL